MPTRNINLTDHLDGFVEKRVASGAYQNASEVVREGLRLLEQRDEENALRLRRLQEAADAGFADIEQGRYRDVSPEDLEDYVAEIGRRASASLRRTG